MSNEIILDVKNLSTVITTDRVPVRIVKDVSFQLRRWRTLAIVGISRRETTVRPTAASALVSRAMLWLRANALSAPHVEDVARAVFVSPSLLERRFREIKGESVYAAMLRIRMDEVKRRLRETAEPIADITRDCGWPEPEPPKRLFKRMFGMSMRDWRGKA